jgi:hypothetical protein
MSNNKPLDQSGFHVVLILIVMLVLTAIGLVAWKVSSSKSGSTEQLSAASTSETTDTVDPKDPTKPPLAIKNIGINLNEYDPATNKAGDIVFIKTGLESYDNVLFFDYGALAEANSAAQARLNPQPTFIVPLGTKIHSLVDGVVVNVPKLYSNDYSIQVATSKDSPWLYETEHVINPTVKVGDTVKAGQIIAEASTHDSQYHPGFGLYEIGILHAGNPPQHVCPFNYLDDSIKQDTFTKLTSLYKSWETYMGNTDLYHESNLIIPGCLTLDPIDG